MKHFTERQKNIITAELVRKQRDLIMEASDLDFRRLEIGMAVEKEGGDPYKNHFVNYLKLLIDRLESHKEEISRICRIIREMPTQPEPPEPDQPLQS